MTGFRLKHLPFIHKDYKTSWLKVLVQMRLASQLAHLKLTLTWLQMPNKMIQYVFT